MNKISSRDRLFQEALHLFNEQGYRETTVGDIEQAAGLTPRAGGFYRHFKSKEDVVVHAIERMSKEMIAELRVEDVISLRSPRAELLTIARALMHHAEVYRPIRLLLQREGYKLPALRKAARKANKKLGTLDVVPWVADVLKRSGKPAKNLHEMGLTIFGPVLIYIYSLDRGDPAFGVDTEPFLNTWADHWARWLG